IVGLFNLALIYFLYMDLRHSNWLLERKNKVEPMFLSFFIPVGVFLLTAARRPSEHRWMIALSSLVEHLPWRADGYSNRGSLDSQRPHNKGTLMKPYARMGLADEASVATQIRPMMATSKPANEN